MAGRVGRASVAMATLTGKYKHYPSYKPAQLDGIMKIPSHWEEKRLKFVANIEAGQSPPSDRVSNNLNGLPFLQGNAEFGDVSPKPRFACKQPPKTSKAGDILLSVRAPVGAVNIADQDYGIGRGLCTVQPHEKLDRLFAYYLIVTVRSNLNSSATGSTYDAVTAADVGDLVALLPPLPEQRAIAAFLDRETEKIDSLIAKKERLVELLQEKRSARISRAVTKGLDLDAPMKDSGVEWLGEISAHWEVKRLKFVAQILAGQSPPSEEVSGNLHELPFLQGNAEFGPLSPTARFACGTPPKRSSTGDILLSVRAPVGAVNVSDQDYGIGRGLCAIRPHGALGGGFAYYLILTIRSLLNRVATGSTYDAVTTSDVGDLVAILPPSVEQCDIADYLDGEIARIDALISKISDAIKRLKEFRTSLISAAVTGKIDVREESG